MIEWARWFLLFGCWVIFTSVLCGPAPALSMDLPESPDGYSWKEIRDLKAAFLIPENWQFDSEVSAGQYFFTITKKGNDPPGSGETGLTIVVRTGAGNSARQGIAPSQFAAAMFNEIRKNRELERMQRVTQGPFETIRYQYTCTSAGSTQLREYSLLVANDQTGTLYIFAFAAPLSTWDADWQTVTVVLDTIFLDDEI